MTEHVALHFDGDSRGAVAAARQATGAVKEVQASVQQKAAKSVEAQAKERRSAEELIVEYKKIAAQAKRGSEEQVAALQLVATEQRKLSTVTREHESQSVASFRRIRTSILATGAAYLGAQGLISVMEAGVKGAAELGAQVDATTVIFGEHGKEVQAWAKGMLESFGIADETALGFVNTVGRMVKGLGLAPPEVAAMSKSVVELAQDMGALTHQDPAGFIAAFDQALAGRTRGLKQYAVFIDDAAIKAEALSLHLVKADVDSGKLALAQDRLAVSTAKAAKAQADYGTSSTQYVAAHDDVLRSEQALDKLLKGKVPTLTAAQRAEAVYALTIKQTADAHDYYAKHADRADLVDRKLHEGIKQIETEVGIGLLPLLKEYGDDLASWLSKSENQEKVQHAVATATKDVASALHTAIPIIKELWHDADHVANAVGGWKHLLELLLALKFASVIGGWTRAITGDKGLLPALRSMSSKPWTVKVSFLLLGADLLYQALNAIHNTSAADAAAQAGFPAQSTLTNLGKVTRGGQALRGKTVYEQNGQLYLGIATAQGGYEQVKKLTQEQAAKLLGLSVKALADRVAKAAAAATGPAELTSEHGAGQGVKGVGTMAGLPAPLAAAIQSAAAKYGIPGSVLAGIWHIESGSSFPNPYVNSSGYGGLFGTGQGSYKWSTQAQADYAAKILAGLIRKNHGNLAAALHEYSGGGYSAVQGVPTGTTITTAATGGGETFGGGGGGVDTGGVGPLTVGTKPKKPPAPPLVSDSFTEAVSRAKTQVRGALNAFAKDAALRKEIAALLNLQDALEAAEKDATGKRKEKIKAALERVASDLAGARKDLATAVKKENAQIAAGRAHDALATEVAKLLGLSGEDLIATGPRGEGGPVGVVRGRSTAALKRLKTQLQNTLKQVSRDLAADRTKIAPLFTLSDDLLIQGGTDSLGRPLPPTTAAALKQKVRQLFDAVAKAVTPAEKKKAADALARGIDDALSQAAAGVQAAQSKFETAFGRVEDKILSAFDRQTQSHLQGMQRDFQTQVDGMQRALDQKIAGMQKALQARIAAVQAAGAAPTPAEAQLAQLQAAHDAAQAAQDLASAQSELQAALASGDQDRIRQAQQALDEIQYQQRVADLQKQADAERAARDKDTQAQVDALQEQESNLEQSLRDQLAIQIQAMQDAEAAREQDYQDQRDAQRQALTDQLADWEQHLLDGSASMQDFIAWLAGQGASGFLAGTDLAKIDPVAAMADAGDAQGSAFVQAFIAQLQAAAAAYNDFLAQLATGQPITIGTGRPSGGGSTGGTGHGIGRLGFAAGGKVPGTFVGREDTIMARVSPEEYVIDRTTTKRLNAFLDSAFAGRGGPTININEPVFWGTTERQAKRTMSQALKSAGGELASYTSPV